MVKKMTRVFVLSARRTPFGRFGGSLKDLAPEGKLVIELTMIVLKELLEKANKSPDEVDEVYWGVGDSSQCHDVYTPVVLRQAWLKCGFNPKKFTLDIDRACCSGMDALMLGYRAILLGEAGVTIGGGVTCFSQEPLIIRGLRWKGYRLGLENILIEDPLYRLGYKDFNPVAVDTGEVALEYGVSREEQDMWALRSHQRYGKAWQEGKFKDEIIPLEVPIKDERGRVVGKKVLEIDEQYRPDASLEKLSKLPTIYGSPTVTAGNAPGLNDGAAGCLIASEEKVGDCKPLGEIVAMAYAAQEARYIASVPAYAIIKVLEKAKLSLDDMKLIEINEAFAAQPLVSTKILCQEYYGGNEEKLKEIREKTNVNGSAIAIGHPNTASGARLVMHLLYELRRRGGGYGVAAICGGLAQGSACIVKV